MALRLGGNRVTESNGRPRALLILGPGGERLAYVFGKYIVVFAEDLPVRFVNDDEIRPGAGGLGQYEVLVAQQVDSRLGRFLAQISILPALFPRGADRTKLFFRA